MLGVCSAGFFLLEKEDLLPVAPARCGLMLPVTKRWRGTHVSSLVTLVTLKWFVPVHSSQHEAICHGRIIPSNGSGLGNHSV